MAGNIFWLLTRIAVGSIFTYAGFAKLTEPVENLRAVLAAYPPIPGELVIPISRVLPWTEFIFGSFLVLGYVPCLSALILGTLLAGFLTVLGISRFVYGVSPEDCGCFGQSGIHLSVPQVLILDSISLVAAVKLARMRQHPWSLEHWLINFGDKNE